MSNPAVYVEVVEIPQGAISPAWWAAYDAACLEPRAGVEGVIAARRGTGVVGSVAAIAVYDLADVAVATGRLWSTPTDLEGPAVVAPTLYRQLISTVDDYLPPGTAVLHAAFFEAEPAHHDEFNDWYNLEHIPAIAAVEGYDNCRRFTAVDDERRFLALYDVTTLDVANSNDVVVATSSPWSDRIRAKIATYRERRVFTIDRVVSGAAAQQAV